MWLTLLCWLYKQTDRQSSGKNWIWNVCVVAECCVNSVYWFSVWCHSQRLILSAYHCYRYILSGPQKKDEKHFLNGYSSQCKQLQSSNWLLTARIHLNWTCVCAPISTIERAEKKGEEEEEESKRSSHSFDVTVKLDHFHKVMVLCVYEEIFSFQTFSE